MDTLGSIETKWEAGPGGENERAGLTDAQKISISMVEVGLSATEFAKQVGISIKSGQNLRRLGFSEKEAQNRAKFFTWLNAALEREVPIDLAAFRAFDPGHVEPVRVFARWLRSTGSKRRAWRYFLPRPQDVYFPSSNGREAVVDEVMRFLGRRDLNTVKVVHQTGMTEGLRALAGHLFYHRIPSDRRLDDRDVCYLPVTRFFGSSERVSFARLVGFLEAFYSGGKPTDATISQNAEDLRRQLERLRGLMQRRPAILIFDGYTALTGALRELHAFIRDDALIAFLREALHPQVGRDFPGPAGSQFYANRFLILADRPIPGFEPYSDAPEPLPYPPSEEMSDVMGAQPELLSPGLTEVFTQAENISDVTVSVADAILSLPLKIKPSISETSLSQLRPAYQALVKALRESNPTAVFALHLLGLMQGGLRYTTFIRLVDQWNRLREGDRDYTANLATLRSGAEVKATLAQLKSILVHGRDEVVAGLDESEELYVYLEDEPLSPEMRSEHNDRMSFDLRSADLRREILVELTEHVSEVLIARMHRLLAEEALRQQTLVMRHAEWRGTADVRYYRRLCQMLVHGLASFPPEQERTDSKSPQDPVWRADVPAVLPSEDVAAYRRIYAVFFRALLDHPPHFDLTRSLGRDALKCDLLLAAMSAGQPPEQLLVAGLNDQLPICLPALLPLSGPDAWSDGCIVLEQALSLVRAAFHSEQRSLCDSAIKQANLIVGKLKQQIREGIQNEPADSEAARLWKSRKGFLSRQSMKIAKVDIDFALQADPGKAQERLSKALREVDCPSSLMNAADTIWVRMSKPANSVAAEIALKAAVTDLLSPSAVGKDATHMAMWSDLLSRQGEIAARLADSGEGAKRVANLAKAFLWFYVSEQLRRRVFDAEPLGRRYVINGHQSRALVRVSLQIVRGFGRYNVAANAIVFRKLPRRAFYVRQARRHIDLHTRYSARYPSERPSLLILQATFTRSVATTPENMRVALRLLAEADSLMFATPDRPGVRRRLLLERLKVLRMLIEATSNPATHAALGSTQHWATLAVFDAVRLRRLASISSPMWNNAAIRQARLLRTELSKRGVHIHPDVAPADRLVLRDLDPGQRTPSPI